MARKPKPTMKRKSSTAMVHAVGVPPISAEARRYRAKDDLGTLTRAHEIMSDRGRHSEAKREAQRQQAALGKIAQLTPKGK
ncbi:MAG: hypothetical protein KGI71_06605 [Patescibacteria group bacterium]|nr:hypothetical protein [Patescibacteria group bacterium]